MSTLQNPLFKILQVLVSESSHINPKLDVVDTGTDKNSGDDDDMGGFSGEFLERWIGGKLASSGAGLPCCLTLLHAAPASPACLYPPPAHHCNTLALQLH